MSSLYHTKSTDDVFWMVIIIFVYIVRYSVFVYVLENHSARNTRKFFTCIGKNIRTRYVFTKSIHFDAFYDSIYPFSASINWLLLLPILHFHSIHLKIFYNVQQAETKDTFIGWMARNIVVERNGKSGNIVLFCQILFSTTHS